VRRPCIGITVRTGRYHPEKVQPCRKPGYVYLGAGQWVCAVHHQYGWVPAMPPPAQDSLMQLRAAAVLGDE